jgi:AcrR family transcriptional regulator
MTAKSVPERKSVRQLKAAARQLFYRYGIRRVTVEEICTTAGVSKMTFYKYFDNKTDLAKHVLGDEIENGIQRFCDIRDQDIPFTDKVKQWIELKMDQTGGMSLAFLRDLIPEADPDLQGWYAGKVKENTQLIIKAFREAQNRGEISQQIRIEFMLYFLNHMQEMVSDDRLLALYPDTQSLSHELMNLFFYGILPSESREDT